MYCRTLTFNGKKLTTEEVCISLTPPAGRQQLRSGGGVANWRSSGGIARLEDLSVESKAVGGDGVPAGAVVDQQGPGQDRWAALLHQTPAN